MLALAPAYHHLDASNRNLPVSMGVPVKTMPVALAQQPRAPVMAQGVPKPRTKAEQAFLDKGHSEEEWEAKQAIKKAKQATAKAKKVAKDKAAAKDLARLHTMIRELKKLLRNPPEDVDRAIKRIEERESEGEGESEEESEGEIED